MDSEVDAVVEARAWSAADLFYLGRSLGFPPITAFGLSLGAESWREVLPSLTATERESLRSLLADEAASGRIQPRAHSSEAW